MASGCPSVKLLEEAMSPSSVKYDHVFSSDSSILNSWFRNSVQWGHRIISQLLAVLQTICHRTVAKEVSSCCWWLLYPVLFWDSNEVRRESWILLLQFRCESLRCCSSRQSTCRTWIWETSFFFADFCFYWSRQRLLVKRCMSVTNLLFFDTIFVTHTLTVQKFDWNDVRMLNQRRQDWRVSTGLLLTAILHVTCDRADNRSWQHYFSMSRLMKEKVNIKSNYRWHCRCRCRRQKNTVITGHGSNDSGGRHLTNFQRDKTSRIWTLHQDNFIRVILTRKQLNIRGSLMGSRSWKIHCWRGCCWSTILQQK